MSASHGWDRRRSLPKPHGKTLRRIAPRCFSPCQPMPRDQKPRGTCAQERTSLRGQSLRPSSRRPRCSSALLWRRGLRTPFPGVAVGSRFHLETCSARSCEVQTSTARAIGSCSAWASMSAAQSVGLANSSATINVSVGPYSPSMPTSPYTIFLASVTNTLPGPQTMSTGGTVSVPYAMAAIA